MLRQAMTYMKGDKVIWLVIFTLSVFSLLAVYSATGTLAYKYKSGNTEYYLIKQLLLLGGGLGVIYATHLLDYRYYSRIAQLLLLLSIPLLLYTLFFGTNINEAKRWITLPVVNITFQTSDLAKLALIMYTARLLSKKQGTIKSFKDTFVPVLLPVFVITLSIAPEDLSTAVVLFATCLVLMFIGRVAIWQIAGLVLVSGATIGLFVMLLFAMPQEQLDEMGRMATWKSRIESYMDTDTYEVSYQVKQAKIAIAKGGFFPNGPGNSTQRNFLPHPYSDFIYAIIIEEYGLIGGVFVMFLYLALLFQSVRIVGRSPKAFGALLAFGLSLSLVIQAMINMGVAVNFLPVTGMTLPLISMGGSSVVFTSIALGIILSVSRESETELETEEIAI